MSSLAIRSLSAVVLIGIFIGATAVGKQGLEALFALVALGIQIELFYALYRPNRAAKWVAPLVFTTTVGAAVWAPYYGFSLPLPVYPVGLITTLITLVLSLDITHVTSVSSFSTAALLGLAANYGLSGFFRCCAFPALVIAAVLAVAINDTFAYFWGKALGRHKLTSLSPSKTIEGFVLGGLTTVAASFCVAPALRSFGYEKMIPNATVVAPVLGIAASIVCPFGGFLASAVKRAYGLKDYSQLIPGHGGLTDRFDCQIVMGACLVLVRSTDYLRHFH